MGQYDVYLVCKNGHGINDNYVRSPEFNKDFCTICGEKTIHSCPNCGKDIRGDYHVPGVIVASARSTPVPDICQYCGGDFPWRRKEIKIDANKTSSKSDHMAILDLISRRFQNVAKQLQFRHGGRSTIQINDEYDVQDLFHAILRLYYEDIREEEWNPSYAGSSSRSDFLLKELGIVIEIKKTRPNLKEKQVGEQLTIDIAKYKNHPDCKTLFCLVYDPEGHIKNPKGIENDLNKKAEEFEVVVCIVPK